MALACGFGSRLTACFSAEGRVLSPADIGSGFGCGRGAGFENYA